MAKSVSLLKIEQLDPRKDAWEIIRLSLLYEFPWDFNRALELALYKTFAIPSISKILFQSKEFEKYTQKRYDDTDLLLSEIIENGIADKAGRGWKALQQMNWIHSNYKISNEDYLYVLSTFIFDTAKWINQYGYRQLTQQEELAGFYVWKEIGEQMHIENIPDTIADFRTYYETYEARHFAYSEANIKVARATENLMLGWYLPEFMFSVSRPFLHAVMEPHLLKAFNYAEPGDLLRKLVSKTLRARSKAASLMPRTQPYIRTRDHHHRAYPNGYLLEELGPAKLMNSPKCPYHKVINNLKKTI